MKRPDRASPSRWRSPCQSPGTTGSLARPRHGGALRVHPPTCLRAIAFNRVTPAGVGVLPIRTNGTDEVYLFKTSGCSCIGWSPTGEELWSVSETDHGTIAFTTVAPDGSRRTVVEPPIAGLSLAPGAGTDGDHRFQRMGRGSSLSGVWLGRLTCPM